MHLEQWLDVQSLLLEAPQEQCIPSNLETLRDHFPRAYCSFQVALDLVLQQRIKMDSLLEIWGLQLLRLINNHQVFFETQESTSFLGKKLLVLACSFLDVYVKQKRLNFSMFTAVITKLPEVGDVVKISSLGRKATVVGVDPCNMKLKLKFNETGVEWWKISTLHVHHG